MVRATDPKALTNAIDTVLLDHWDPIGIRDVPQARDEYDEYAAHIRSMLLRGAPSGELAAYLLAVEVRSLGLEGDPERVKVVAAMLHDLPQPERMILGGIKDLLPFLEFLRDHKIWFRMESLHDDAMMVEIHLVGIRLEVEFFDDHIEYSLFTGDESVEDDQKKLFDLLNEHGA